MNTKKTSYGFAQEADVVPKLEGMEIEFDEQVTLFPVELEEIREVAPKSVAANGRNGKGRR
jgi:hypothetical protein